MGGIAWYLAGRYDPAIVLLPLAVLAASMLISYERAKADALGFDARGGLMERAERFVALGIAVLFPVLLIPVLWVMLVLTLFTAGQRFVSVWRQASAPRPTPSSPWRSRRAVRTTTERARARRERWAAARQARRDASR
jgi:CDP-diacylglycerol--glycerol-3-phosphate 3-phosphatidyltransferase